MMLRALLALVLVCPLSHAAEGASPWGQEVPPAVASTALMPDSVLDEAPCDWRTLLEPIFRPVVQHCHSAREAVLAVASHAGELTGVHYDRARRHPCMNAQEALAEKKVSCTGQSILLVCALRSVGIPARAVGVATWNHVCGNHTWVEAWVDGQWLMVEFNESEFNTPWVMEAIGMLDPQNLWQRIVAAQPGGAALFPTLWNPQSGVEAVDVTERYLELARQWYAHNGVPAESQKLMVDVHPRDRKPRTLVLEDADGAHLAHTKLPTSTDDVSQFATLLIPRGIPCRLRVEGSSTLYPLSSTEAAVQIIRLHLSDQP